MSCSSSCKKVKKMIGDSLIKMVKRGNVKGSILPEALQKDLEKLISNVLLARADHRPHGTVVQDILDEFEVEGVITQVIRGTKDAIFGIILEHHDGIWGVFSQLSGMEFQHMRFYAADVLDIVMAHHGLPMIILREEPEE